VKADIADQQFYIKIENADPMNFGDDVNYELSIRQMSSSRGEESAVDGTSSLLPGPAIILAGHF